MAHLLMPFADAYTTLRHFWEKVRVQQRITRVLIAIFVLMGFGIALNNVGLIPESIAHVFPVTPYFAIRLAFTLILALEVIELTFAIADSVSSAVGKQLEIMALIMLRECFTAIGKLEAHIALSQDYFVLFEIGITAVAGLLLFVFRGIFARLHTSSGCRDMTNYIIAKKCVSVVLLVVFAIGGCYDLFEIVVVGKKSIFFQLFYTSLIFTDILMVLVSQHYQGSFYATFRYSGYAVSTLLLRISFGAPHYLAPVMCIFAGLFLLALTWSTNRFITKEQAAEVAKFCKKSDAAAPDL